ncbi:MAG: hypothetical protein WC635_14520 [Bacteriovorax sp.]|jgi:hypothetical protein
MKKIITSFIILTTGLLLVSCSHQKNEERSVASQSCWDSVKGEYQSYFDSVEKCIEKQSDK